MNILCEHDSIDCNLAYVGPETLPLNIITFTIDIELVIVYLAVLKSQLF